MLCRMEYAAVVVTLALAACAAPQGQSLVGAGVAAPSQLQLDRVNPDGPIPQNGSFETPVVPSGSYQEFATGQHFAHWAVTGKSGNVAVIGKGFTYDGYALPAKCGNQFLDLTGSSNSKTGVVQSVPTLSGKTYTIAFQVGNVVGGGNLGTSSTVLVYVNGKKIYTAKNTKGKGLKHIVWEAFSTQFAAQADRTAIKFLNGDPPSDTANGLDCISITQT